MDLVTALRAERLASYYRLRGGYPVPLAGGIWWTSLAFAGFAGLSPGRWNLLAFVTSGLIFPLALGLSRVLRVDFMRDRTVVTDVLVPTFLSMMLFWPIAISAFWTQPVLVPLVLAIGMSIHWPVIGWSYGRPALYSAHALVRAVLCFVIWNWLPQGRFTILPMAVALVYFATVAALLMDSRRATQALQQPAS